jgi:hypothetical protein
LVKEQEEDDIKEIKIRLILTRIVDRLHMLLRGENTIEKQLYEVLSRLQEKSPKAVGYAKANILNLLGIIEAGVQRP